MRKDIVVIHPYVEESSLYISMMQSFVKKKYRVISYDLLRRRLLDFDTINALYLNWFENNMDDVDRMILLEAIKYGVKIVWTFHNKIPHDTQGDYIKVDNIKFLMNVSDTIILHSKSSIKYLIEYGLNDIDKCTYIPIPDYKDNYYSLKSQEYPEWENTFVYGHVGLLRPYKNIELAIKAFKQINSDDVRMLFLGKFLDDDYYCFIKDIIKDDKRIKIINRFVPDFEMAYCLSLINVMILPYNLESSMNSSALITAGSYRITSIISNIAMVDDIPEEYIYKYQFENEDDHVNSLNTMMIQAYEERNDKLPEKGEKLYNHILVNNSKNVVAQLLLKCFG